MRALILSLFFAIPAFAEPIKYELVPDPESISFTYSFDERDFTGYFPTYTADIALDWDRAANSSLDVEIQTGDASAGFIFASQTLRGPEMLWSQKYPAMRFVSTDARAVEGGATITGDLTIRDVTKPVTLQVKLFRAAGTQPGERDNLKFVATTSLSRSAFGANGYPKLVDDELGITINGQIKRIE